ncbi:PAS domain-containing sensor histidine kinase [Pararhizobium sp. IMCC21322]|uniref:PAS domain-containing sensor histidine kinase n=1 Tax=Pararhizobium sp. IMCC21322 TaxID=3067903 RepID=UPI00274143E9|nr:ATP-binding protein [Pararhizobium sp. IMCC21322]
MSWTACEPLNALALSVKPALVLSPDGAQLLWANPAGAKRLGTQDLKTLLSEEFPQNFPLRKQIRHLFNWLHNDKQQIQRLRLGRSASTPLEMVTVSKLRNVEGVAGVLLRPVAGPTAQDFQQRADTMADWLGSGHHYAALFSNTGDVIASSGAFHELRHAATALQSLLEEAEDSVLPVSQQITIQSGTRNLVTALKLPMDDEEVFLLLVDADEASFSLSDDHAQHERDTNAQGNGEQETDEKAADVKVADEKAAGPAETGLQSVRQNHAGRLSASEIKVPKPANDTRPQQIKAPEKTEVPAKAAASAEPDLMRFVWRMDDGFKFTFVSPEFQTLVGLRGAFEGRTWQDLAGDYQLDPDGELQSAITSKDSWSGKHIIWALPKRKKIAGIELSAMPVFDAEKRFQGYRGFGACQLQDQIITVDEPPVQDNYAAMPDEFSSDGMAADVFDDAEPDVTVPKASVVDAGRQNEPDEVPAIVDTRPSSTQEYTKGLTPEERKAFEEIGKSLGKHAVTQQALAKQDLEKQTAEVPEAEISVTETPIAETPDLETPDLETSDLETAGAEVAKAVASEAGTADQEQGSGTENSLRAMLDRIDTGVLVVRDDQVLFANRSLAEMAGYEDAQSYLAANVAAPMGGFSLDRVGDDGTMQLTGKDDATHKVRAAIGKIDWDGQSASLLTVDPVNYNTPVPALSSQVGDRVWNADELLAILNTATEGVLMIDVEGKILALNHGAEALFDEDQTSLIGRDLTTLLALESHKPARDYLAGIKGAGVASILNDGREVIGQTAKGGYMPLFMTMGQVGEESPDDVADMRLCVVLRDITQWKRAEDDLIAARHNAEKANTAKSDFLAKISHEIRTPLNAILGFSEVMLEERFGPIGNPRYKDYINDIHTSGAHVINLVNDMLDISKIEAGQLDLTFTAVDLVAVLKECVALMQPQANEGRVIIRTSFADDLPRVVADAKTIRQIALNLLSNSIKFTAEGGQVIVSAVVEKDGSLILRVRDTGVGMSEADLSKAMEPFRQIEQNSEKDGIARKTLSGGGTGLGLPLTKALVEANRAQFLIESTPSKGTLIRVVFPNTRVLAE